MIQISKYNKQHPLRVFEAFAGYGSQSLAFKYLKEKHPEFDFKVVGYSEIEPSAIQAYGLLHGRDITNYGDVTRIDWNEVPDFDFISWSSPQNRERIFVISILRTEDDPNPEYHFPSPIKLETTVEDILEDDVSPEYYLSQPLLEKYLTKADINESIQKLYPEDFNTQNG